LDKTNPFNAFVQQLAKYTFSRNNSQSPLNATKTGSGWSDEGMLEFNRLCHLVMQDREERGDNFRYEFLRHREQKLAKKTKGANSQEDSSKKPKVTIYSDLDRLAQPFPDASSSTSESISTQALRDRAFI
jgi:hypothetical protein